VKACAARNVESESDRSKVKVREEPANFESMGNKKPHHFHGAAF
jgi:hypothetical protein